MTTGGWALLILLILFLLGLAIGLGIYFYKIKYKLLGAVIPSVNSEGGIFAPLKVDWSTLTTYCVKHAALPFDRELIDSNVSTCDNNNWTTLTTFKAFNTYQMGTIPICVAIWGTSNDNYSTVIYLDKATCDGSDHIQKIVFYAYPDEKINTIPICIGNTGTEGDSNNPFRSTVISNQKSCTQYGWTTQGVFYAYPITFIPPRQLVIKT